MTYRDLAAHFRVGAMSSRLAGLSAVTFSVSKQLLREFVSLPRLQGLKRRCTYKNTIAGINEQSIGIHTMWE
jgi:hypothetical protein